MVSGPQHSSPRGEVLVRHRRCMQAGSSGERFVEALFMKVKARKETINTIGRNSRVRKRD